MSLIFTSYAFILHQLLTLNVKFVYFIIPILAAFSHIYVVQHLDKKKLSFPILILTLIFSSYYFFQYVNERKFVVPFDYYDKKIAVRTNIIDNKYNFNWISSLNSDPKKEIKNIEKIITFFKSNPEKGNYTESGTSNLTEKIPNFSWIHISYIEGNNFKENSVSSLNPKTHEYYEDNNTYRVGNFTHRIKEACINYKRSLLTGDFDRISELMETYWRNKLETNPHVASPEILDSYNFALQNGATAAKISGAGGGGHMVLFTEFEKRHQLVSALEAKEGRVVPFKFVNHGVDVWRQ